MSEATSGNFSKPAYRHAHAGYLLTRPTTYPQIPEARIRLLRNLRFLRKMRIFYWATKWTSLT